MSILRFDPFRDPFRDMERLTSQMVSGVRTPALMPMDAWKEGRATASRWTCPAWTLARSS